MQKREVFLLMGLLILSIFALPLVPTSSESFIEPEQGQRTVKYHWYSWFNLPDRKTGKLGEWWKEREAGGEDFVVRDTYPMITAWESSLGNIWYYTVARLKVTGRNLPEINMTKGNSFDGKWVTTTIPYKWVPTTKMLGVGEFLPFNLTGHTPTGTAPGNAKLNFYMNYLTADEWPGTDGWIVSWNGTIELDLNAAKRVLGITDTDLVNVTDWWINNKDAVKMAWGDWLSFEGNKRLDIYNFYAYMYSLSDIRLNVRRVGDKVFVDLLNEITWGQDYLFARWFKETFLPQYEYGYEDLYLNATITPTYADVDLDTGVTYWSYAYPSTWYNTPSGGVAGWQYETVWGDVQPATKMHPLSEYDPYMWPNGTGKKYYVEGPANSLTGQWMAYDYVPSCWNLKQGETLDFEVPVHFFSPGYLDQGKLHVGSGVCGNTTEVWGYLKLEYMEPNIKTEYLLNGTAIPPAFPTSGPGSISWNPDTRLLTFTGPIDFYNWSKNTILGIDDPLAGLAANWKHLSYYTYSNGTTVYTPTLPWGCPYIAFAVLPGVVVDPPMVENASLTAGKTFSVNVNLTYARNLNNWTLSMSYKPDILQVVKATEGSLLKAGGTTTFHNGTIGVGTLTGIDCSLGTGHGLNTTGGTLATVTFKVLGAGESDLNLTSAKLFDSAEAKIETELVNGFFSNVPHDIAIESVTPSSTSVTVGDSVSIDVKVKNTGQWQESNIGVTTYFNDTAIQTKTVTSLNAGADTTLTFEWNTTSVTPGNYTIKAVASTVPGEFDTADNTKVDGTVQIKEAVPPPTDYTLYYIAAGVVVAVVLVIVAVYFMRKRKPKPSPA